MLSLICSHVYRGLYFSAFLMAAVAMSGASAQDDIRPVDDARLLIAGKAPAETGNWLSFGRDFSNQRFSPLTAINKTSVAKLAPAWIYQMGSLAPTPTHPIVVDGVMYFTSPSSDVIAVNAATGDEIWRYRHKLKDPSTINAARNRGAAVAYDKVYVGTDDHRVVVPPVRRRHHQHHRRIYQGKIGGGRRHRTGLDSE
jgi:alcohol dehydrogenase (cytochrome c)